VCYSECVLLNFLVSVKCHCSSDVISRVYFMVLKMMFIHIFIFFCLWSIFYIGHGEMKKMLKNKVAYRHKIRKYIFKQAPS
jgi:hypothetical protein